MSLAAIAGTRVDASAQGISPPIADEAISYSGLTFQLPHLGWERAESQCCLTLTRTISPERRQMLIVVPVSVPRELPVRTLGQHMDSYFAMQREQPRRPENQWRGLSEQIQEADGREYASIQFTISRDSSQAAPSVHGRSVLIFPTDFAQRQVFYCFMWTDEHPPESVPTADDLAPFVRALASISPPPTPLVEAILVRMANLIPGQSEKSADLAGAKARAVRAAETTRGATTHSSLLVVRTDQAEVRIRSDFVAPDRYHMLQTAPGMSTELVKIGKATYQSLGAAWLKTSIAERVDNLIAVEKFLKVLAEAEPVSATEFAPQGARYIILDYNLRRASDFGFMTNLAREPTRVRIWIDEATNLVARGEFTTTSMIEGKRTVVSMQQSFSGYGLLIRIEPPPT